ncbi:protein O-linked-mannose beta-1,2-N-acetylglucosaminyltransferase 1-like [Oratosquilla oratoria]|uniref:protein O-linked-mannose beta-1,2-N-acetylglucosaminyltransferase 1-like n=1 Tax=Oratosquilla oratoria TaxID=337810 RepID=UPI003F76F250
MNATIACSFDWIRVFVNNNVRLDTAEANYLFFAIATTSSMRTEIIPSFAGTVSKMDLTTFLRGRLCSKTGVLLKSLVLPLMVLYLAIQVFFTKSSEQIEQDLNHSIRSGKKLDPILDKAKSGYHKMMTHKSKLEIPDARESKSSTSSPGRDESVKAPPVRTSAWSLATANITDKSKVRFKPHSINDLTVTLTLMSSADKIFMSLNKKEIYRNLKDRGIHIVVLNQYTGRPMAKRVFDTFSMGLENEMNSFIDNIQDGRIVVFAVRDEASKELTWVGRNKIREFGSRWINKLSYRDMWALVARKGGIKLAETYSNVATADTGYEYGGPVFLRIDLVLKEGKGECNWPSNERNDARRIFCLKYDGYGSLCNCDVKEWEDVFFSADGKLHRELTQKKIYKELGIAILASNRPHYLYRTVKSLWEAPGVNRNQIVVYLDSPHKECMAVNKLFGIHTVVRQKTGNTTEEVIRHKCQRMMKDLMGTEFPASSIPGGAFENDVIPPFMVAKLLILEDDIEVSIDAFKYLYNVGEIMDIDETVLGVSLYNYYGTGEVSSSLTTSYRTNTIVHLALMTSALIAKEHIAPAWPKNTSVSL